MSLNAFKETLKPCTNQPSSSSSSSQNSSILSHFNSPINPRKPPKSSLSQQLLRLENPFDLPQTQPKIPKKETFLAVKPKEEHDDDNEEEEQEEGKRIVFGGPKLESNLFEHTGPYEPLILSPPGEIPIVQVPASINCRLLKHQIEGVKFLYNLYRNNHGGVLADDMGLGKTIQTIAFLAAVFGKDGESGSSTLSGGNKMDKRGPVLILCPSSIIQNWEDEFSKWSTFDVSIYHGQNRDLIIDKLRADGVEILVTSFDTYRIHGGILSVIQWEMVIVDEAHRLKNEKSKLYSACSEIKTMKRYGLTGTPIQNNIMELFNLLDWVVPGCLGTREHFREYYNEPLKHGQRSSASERFIETADQRKQHLVELQRKYLLRRTKEETIGHLMMGKEDNVVFCAMSDVQKRVYQRTLQLPDFQCLINKDLPCSCGSPLKQAECCKRIVPNGVIWPYLHKDNPDGCDTCPICLVLPCINKLRQISNHLELIKPNPRDDPDKQRKDAEFASAVFGADLDLVGGNTANESFMGLSDVKHCGKMRALEKLMVSWLSRGDKVLLFSYSVRMLDILEKFLIRKGYSFSRLDGSTPTSLRQSLVDDFNSTSSKQVFLISTRAGGLGLNLVSANRVVVFDPQWNPAHDLQAQDRSFRYGQKRHVVVFRLLGAGTLEELVYTRQVYKQQLANIAISGKMETRYFEGVQDCKEFQGELFGIANLFRDLSDKLFTSEIIELNDKQQEGTKQDMNELGIYFVPHEGDSERYLEASENSKPKDEKNRTVLEELGILYAHRNEHIVNHGPSIQEFKETQMNVKDIISRPLASAVMKWKSDAVCVEDNCETDTNLKDIVQRPLTSAVKKRKSDAARVEDNGKNCTTSKSRKKNQYKLLAEFMGMEEVEFSKWLLSASPVEREKVLEDYRNRRAKIPDG